MSVNCNDLIVNVYKFCKNEEKKGLSISVKRPVARCLQLLRISRGKLYRALESQDVTLQELKKRKTKKPRKEKCDDFDIDVIKRHVYNKMENGEVVTLKKLKEQLCQEKDLTISQTTLRKIMKIKLGFRYKKYERDLRLMERPEVVIKRHQYLRKMREYRQQERNIYYTDETWVNAGQRASTKEWQSQEGSGRKLASVGKGGRWIVLDAGSKNGFVPNATLIFKSKSKDGDYHGEMNAEMYEKWMSEKLIPNLPAKSVLVIDNAPYHTRTTDETAAPTKSSTKKVIQEWLNHKGIQFEKDALKAELVELVQKHKPNKKFVIDEMVKGAGHDILRLPPYHCQFNPIEKIWGAMKNYIGSKNSKMNMTAVRDLFEEAHEDVEQRGLWKSFEKFVIKEEIKFWNLDSILEDTVEEIVINTCEDSSTDDESEDNEEDHCMETDEHQYLPICPDFNICRLCGNPERVGENESLWVGCDTCLQWFHNNCLSPQDKEEAHASVVNESQWSCMDCCEKEKLNQIGVCSKCKTNKDEMLLNCIKCKSATHESCVEERHKSSVSQMIESNKGMKALGVSLPLQYLCETCMTKCGPEL